MKKNMTTRSNSLNPVTSEIYTRTQGITALPPLIFKKLVENWLVEFFFFCGYHTPLDPDPHPDPDPYGHFWDLGSVSS